MVEFKHWNIVTKFDGTKTYSSNATAAKAVAQLKSLANDVERLQEFKRSNPSSMCLMIACVQHAFGEQHLGLVGERRKARVEATILEQVESSRSLNREMERCGIPACVVDRTKNGDTFACAHGTSFSLRVFEVRPEE